MGKLKIYGTDGVLLDFDPIDAAGSIPFTADQAMGGHKLTGLGAPTLSADAARKQDVEAVEVTGVIKADGTVAFTGDQAMGGNKLTGVAAPTAAGDALRHDELGLANGIATLDANVLVPEAQIPHTLANALILDGGVQTGPVDGLDGANLVLTGGVDVTPAWVCGDAILRGGSGGGYYNQIIVYGEASGMGTPKVGGFELKTMDDVDVVLVTRLEIKRGPVADIAWSDCDHTGFVYKPVTAPGTPREGEVYYDSGANKLKVWNGSAWEEITSTA